MLLKMENLKAKPNVTIYFFAVLLIKRKYIFTKTKQKVLSETVQDLLASPEHVSMSEKH